MTDGVIVEKIPINRYFRRKVKFWFGMYVWQSITESEGITYEEMGKLEIDKLMRLSFFYAAEYGSVKDNRKILSKATIDKACDLMPQKQMQRIFEAMLKSKIVGKSIIDVASDDKKKQAPKR